MEKELRSYQYEGSELELFAHAIRWKTYFRDRLTPYLGEKVLEVGAGLGGTTRILCKKTMDNWTCLEPDVNMANRLRREKDSGALPTCCSVVYGKLPTPKLEHGSFDTVLYIDVLEHIEDDRQELAYATSYLAKGGSLIVLSPAMPWLFSPFDAALGHFRRYKASDFASLTPGNTKLEHIEYLDSIGLLASLSNRLLLRQSMPTNTQIAFWDTYMVPFSRFIDPLLRFKIGKSIIAIWQKTDIS